VSRSESAPRREACDTTRASNQRFSPGNDAWHNIRVTSISHSDRLNRVAAPASISTRRAAPPGERPGPAARPAAVAHGAPDAGCPPCPLPTPGRQRGMVAAYLVEGTLGLPVFSGTPERGIGVAYMLGPAGGYLLGMPIAAWAVGRCDRRSDSSVWRSSTSPACCGSRGLFRGPASSRWGSRRSFSAVKIGLVAAGAEAARRFAAERR
jgi:BioY family